MFVWRFDPIMISEMVLQAGFAIDKFDIRLDSAMNVLTPGGRVICSLVWNQIPSFIFS